MKLTDEERRIVHRVAQRLFLDGMRPADAWESAMDFITERPETLGESAPATDRDLPTWDADGREIPPEGVAALCRDLHRAAANLYQHRWTCDTLTPAQQAEAWEQLRDALHLPPDTPTPHLPPGTATTAGVAAPTAEAARWSSLVEKVEQVADDICGVGSGVTVDGTPHEWLDAIAREHHRLRIEAARRDRPGTATAAGVGAHEVEVRVGQGDDGTGVPLTARIVRPEADAGTGGGASDELRLGDIVLATTWDTYYQRKEFVVGFISQYDTEFFDTDTITRYTVTRDDGRVFLADRLEKITPEERRRLSSDRREGETPWEHLARIRDAAKGCEAGGAATSAEAVNDECSVLRQLLSVYIHAHDNAKWVPPHIVVEAKKAAWRRAKGGE